MIKNTAKSASQTSAQLKRNKKLQRRWITFMRMCRYGINNFSRNAWLTIAATAVMTITLLIIFSTFVARSILVETVDELKKKVDVSIYLKDEIKKDQVENLSAKLTQLPQVAAVRYISPDDARQSYIRENNPSKEQLDTLAELKKNPFPGTLRVNPKNLNKIDQIRTMVKTDKDFRKSIDPEHPPSYEGTKSKSIDTIGSWIRTAENAGLAAATIFTTISILIIFNTIRMAIFNRKEEIEMMKLIGAEKNFIQGPFVVEAIMYGFFAAIITFILGWVGLLLIKDRLLNYGIAAESTYDFIFFASPFIIIALIAIGALIGIISSFFAVRKHLKI
jgi:cell division transport system permease protein